MALDDIRVSLQLLAESVETLENQIVASEKAQAAAAASQAKQSKSLPQMDMFGNWTGKPVNDGNNVLLAKKLDSTIDKVQNLLREAGAI